MDLAKLVSHSKWAGVGLFGLAIYQLTTGDYSSALASALAGLAAFGVDFNKQQHDGLKREIKQKEIQQAQYLRKDFLSENQKENPSHPC